MNKRWVQLPISLILTAIILTGCGRTAAVEETRTEKVTVQISEEVHSGESKLVIDTSVEIPDLTSLEEISLCFDETRLDTMVEDLVQSQYPGLREESMDGDRKWSVATEEQLLFSFGIMDAGWESGRTYYLDVLRDLNGQHVDEDEANLFTPYYMTKHIPDQIEITPEEAANKMCKFLSLYSCFSYEPWNVAAVNCRNQPGTSGYYQMSMQPQYDGLPVYGHGALRVSACMSEEGIFTFQGIMVLKEQSRMAAEITMSLEEALEAFMADFVDHPQGDLVTVDHIKVGYLAESHYGGTWSLSPVWVFEYHVVTTGTNNQEAQKYYDTCAYRMENGSLYTF